MIRGGGESGMIPPQACGASLCWLAAIESRTNEEEGSERCDTVSTQALRRGLGNGSPLRSDRIARKRIEEEAQ